MGQEWFWLVVLLGGAERKGQLSLAELQADHKVRRQLRETTDAAAHQI